MTNIFGGSLQHRPVLQSDMRRWMLLLLLIPMSGSRYVTGYLSFVNTFRILLRESTGVANPAATPRVGRG